MKAAYEAAPEPPHTGWAIYQRAFLLWLDLETGQVDAARAGFDEFAARRFADLPQDWSWLGVMAVLAEVCAGLGDADRAATLYDLLAPYAHLNLGPDTVASSSVPAGTIWGFWRPSSVAGRTRPGISRTPSR